MEILNQTITQIEVGQFINTYDIIEQRDKIFVLRNKGWDKDE